ncbi:hypothetical protein [Streptomyces sp. NPDC056105]
MTSTSTATRGGFRLLLAGIVVSGFGTSAMWPAAGTPPLGTHAHLVSPP